MDKQPVGPHEFVRLLTIVKVAEALSKKSALGEAKTPAQRMWEYEIGAVVRDHRPRIFDNYPVRLNAEFKPGELLFNAALGNNIHPYLFGHEEILRERYWQMVLLALANSSRPGVDHLLADLLEGDSAIGSDGIRYTRVHGKLIPRDLVQTYLSSIHLDVDTHETRGSAQ